MSRANYANAWLSWLSHSYHVKNHDSLRDRRINLCVLLAVDKDDFCIPYAGYQDISFA
jgi:hypothetical protein